MGLLHPDPDRTVAAALTQLERGVLTEAEFLHEIRTAAFACTDRNRLTEPFPYARIHTDQLDRLRSRIEQSRAALDRHDPPLTGPALLVLDEPEQHSAWWHSLIGQVALHTDQYAPPAQGVLFVRALLRDGHHDQHLTDPEIERLAHYLKATSPYTLMVLSPEIPHKALGHGRATWQQLAHTFSAGQPPN